MGGLPSTPKKDSWAVSWIGEYVTITPEAKDAIRELTTFTPLQTAFVGIACSGSFYLGWNLARGSSSLKRFVSVADIPQASVGVDSPFLRGRAVSVSDGDTFRFLHVPTRFHSSRTGNNDKLSTSTLLIRMCTIDTPEVAKFGKPGQPYGDEAKAHLQSLIENRIVKIRLLQKDQYGRAVAEVVKPGPLLGWPLKYMDQEMLKAGLAEVYQGSGAVYGHLGKEAYIAMQEKAKERKKGMWIQKGRESAADFKARMKAEG